MHHVDHPTIFVDEALLTLLIAVIIYHVAVFVDVHVEISVATFVDVGAARAAGAIPFLWKSMRMETLTMRMGS